MQFRLGLFGAFIAAMTLIFVVQGTRPQVAAQPDISDYETVMRNLISESVDNLQLMGSGSSLVDNIGASGDTLYIAPLIDIAYFMRRNPQYNESIYDALVALTGESENSTWPEWFTWASENDIALPPGYAAFKGELLSTLIDPQFERFWDANVQATARVNLLEAVWGGVRVDGIPSLVNARQITPEEAAIEGETLTRYCRDGDCAYPAADELVFGVYLDGDARAYPLRLLNWHEMFNDVIGHTPMFDAPGGQQICNFRAPTPFQARARDGDWVLINGVSAGCAEEGWVHFADLEWTNSSWETASANLPDVAAGEAALSVDDGIFGSVRGRPVMLAYCTLCGSGILYDATIADLSYTDYDGNEVNMGETVLEFGSTGMLMRSNKLMYDRTTDTVWNALTGVPAFGPLANSDVQLDLLPVVVTDWETWLAEHPDTSVLSLDTGFRRDYTNGAAYGDYFNNDEFIMFPVWTADDSVVENKEMVFGLRFGGEEKAFPLEALIPNVVTNDSVGGTAVTIIARATPERDFFEPGGAAVRAYANNGMNFSAGESASEVIDADGVVWQVTEDALVSPSGETLDRVAGHLAFWFGWLSFYPETTIYEA